MTSAWTPHFKLLIGHPLFRRSLRHLACLACLESHKSPQLRLHHSVLEQSPLCRDLARSRLGGCNHPGICRCAAHPHCRHRRGQRCCCCCLLRGSKKVHLMLQCWCSGVVCRSCLATSLCGFTQAPPATRPHQGSYLRRRLVFLRWVRCCVGRSLGRPLQLRCCAALKTRPSPAVYKQEEGDDALGVMFILQAPA